MSTARFGDVLRVLQPFGAPPTTYEQTRTSIAAYVDGSYSLTPQAEIYLGIRETREHRYSLFRAFFRGMSDEGEEELAHED